MIQMKFMKQASVAKATVYGAFFFLSALTMRSEAASVRISGTVLNQTTKRPAPNAPVQLLRPAGERDKETTVAKGKADANGRFSIGPITVADDDFLIARVNWQKFEYEAPAFDGGRRLQAEPFNMKIDPAKVQVEVYNSTVKYVPLQFTVHHLALKTQSGGVQCTERIVVENNTNQTLLGIGEKGASVLLDIPTKAKDVKLDPSLESLKLVKTQHGYAVSMPVTPAAYNHRNAIIVHYTMAWPSWKPWERTIDLTKTSQYATKFFFVARETDDKKLEVKAPKLGPDQDQPVPIDGKEETRIVNMVGRPMGGEPVVKENEKLDIKVSLPVNPLFWGFLGFMVVLCLLVPVAMLKLPSNKRRAAAAPAKIAEPLSKISVNAGTSSRNANLPDQRINQAGPSFGSDFAIVGDVPSGVGNEQANTLIRQIAELDELHESGKLEKAEYQAQRSVWKEKLVELMLEDESQRANPSVPK